MAERIYLYPIWIRLWHAVNALLCIVLILSGLNMQYAGMGFVIMRFDFAVDLHNWAGVILSISYVWFFVSNIYTKNYRYYKIQFKGWLKSILKQSRYYSYGMFKKEKSPYPVNIDRKFNPLQQISYVIILYVVLPIIFISGWLLLFPEIFDKYQIGVNGLHITDLFHVISAFIVSIFMFVHIYLCTIKTNGSNSFKGMLTGWHE
ncbi:MAG: cytochrome b/b6 domain-containing protein [Bacteroidales bacterium]|nr:cytochrome b/b6 domain-containing protein [Bacteroidales bacterium]